MGKPSVSVVLPVFNGQRFLDAALWSIRRQTLQDIEVVLIDDGSTDASLSIAKAHAVQDKRIHVLSRANRGLVASLNEGVLAARAEWVARMDADDVCTPDRLEAQLAWAGRHKAELCGGAVRTIGGGFGRVRRFPLLAKAIRAQLLFNTAFAHPTVLCRRQRLLDMPYDPAFESAEDYDLWTRMAASGIPMTNAPRVVLGYRVHAAQLTHRRAAQQAQLRARVAQRYVQEQVPEVDPSGGAIVLRREHVLNAADFHCGVGFLLECKRVLGDPEGVVSSNAFAYLMRHGEVDVGAMRSAACMLGLPAAHRIMAGFMALTGSLESGLVYKWMRRFQ